MSIEQNAELIVALAEEIRVFAKMSSENEFKKSEPENMLIVPAVDRAITNLSNKELAKKSDDIFKMRRRRDNAFKNDELFADPAWDLLLELFSAHRGGWNMSVTNTCLAANVPSTTALRWIEILIDVGLAERVADPSDLRRKFIRLTPDAVTKLTKVLGVPASRA